MSERASRFQLRLLGAVLLAAAVVGGGLVLEQRVGVRPLADAPAAAEISGAWFCPHGGGEGWSVWVTVANPGDAPVEVQTLTFGPRAPARASRVVDPGTIAYLEVPAEGMASGTQVEFFGGRVAAGMVVARPKGGIGADACAADASTRWYLPEGTTQRGQQQNLVLMNPFDQEAVLDVVLATGDETLRHGSLTGVVIPPRRAAGFDLNRFALGKRTLAASVIVKLGKVAAAGSGLVEGGGLRLTLGSSRTATEWVLPGAGEDRPTELVVMGATDLPPAPFRVRSQGLGRQQEVLNEASVDPGAALTFELRGRDAGLVAEASGPREFVAARRLLWSATVDQASTPGLRPSPSWVALPPVAATGGDASVLIENPGDELVEVHLRLLTETGFAEVPSLSSLTIGPGRIRTIPLAPLVGSDPVAVLVEALRGSVVVAQLTQDGAFALAPATDMRLP